MKNNSRNKLVVIGSNESEILLDLDYSIKCHLDDSQRNTDQQMYMGLEGTWSRKVRGSQGTLFAVGRADHLIQESWRVLDTM